MKELREQICEAGLHFADCVEKPELRARAREARQLLAADAERASLFEGAEQHFRAALRLAPEEASAKSGLRRARDGTKRAELMGEAERLLSLASADDTRDDERQALFTRARALFERVKGACPDDFAARRGAEDAGSGEDLEQLIADGLKLLRPPPPPPAGGAPPPPIAGGQQLPAVPWGPPSVLGSAEAASGGGYAGDQVAAVAARRERLRKAASCFLTAQQLDPSSVHAARRVTELCKATGGVAVTQDLLSRWDEPEVQGQLAAAERAADLARLRAAHLATIAAKARPDLRGGGKELRVFWSSREEPRFAQREWQRS